MTCLREEADGDQAQRLANDHVRVAAGQDDGLVVVGFEAKAQM